MTDFLKLSQEAYDGSTSYLNTNWRPDIDYSLRAFRSEHATGSKYLSKEYESRSRLFRPKTRSIIRKTEAAGAAALFSNSEVINITSENQDDPMGVASAAAIKEVLEYRLDRTIKTFPLVMGALQDAQTTGAVVSYQYWDYELKNGVKVKDKPCIELRPIENIRLDPGADWIDPINTSPYLCDIIPMYVCQVKRMMNRKDVKTGEPVWRKLDDKEIGKARPDVVDNMRQLRLGKQSDSHQEPATNIGSFDVVWVMRWFMQNDRGDDYTFYTLGTEALLSDPKPIEEVYFHGKRPYVMGYAILETHKVLKSSVPTLIRPLQQETNAISNDRRDNVKFVLHKRWIVARGRQVDVQSLVRGAPGGVTYATDPKNDVQESNWPDVTSSSYVEEDRINADIADVAGDFSPNTKFANKGMSDTFGGTKMAAMGAGMMTDYVILTFIQTWWEEVLRQLVLLEAEYETDEVVLAVCAKKARLFPRFGLSRITDDMLKQEVTIRVNVGMGASNPEARFAKLIMGTNQVMDTILKAPPNFNVQDFVKEAYSHMGYRDGSRFWSDQADPRLSKAMQLVQQLQQALQSKQMDLQTTAQVEQLKLASAERQKAAQLEVDKGRISGDLQIRAAELVVEQQRLALEELKIQSEMAGMAEEHQLKVAELANTINEAQTKLEAERLKLAGVAAKTEAEVQKAAMDLETARASQQAVPAIQGAAQDVTKSMQSVAKEIETARAGVEALSGLKDQVTQQGQALSLLLQNAASSRKAKGFKLKKKEGKTVAVVVENSDGSVEEMPVGQE
jgi:hypothetical protein